MANPEYVLEMRDIVKVFPGVRALDGVKLQVRPGKGHVICGENGAGKSTLMKIINGTYVADEGEMFYKGAKIGPHTVQDTLKMGIAMIYQELNPVLEMTIAENIWLGREPRKGRFVDFGKMQKDTQEQIFVFGVFRPLVYMLYISSILCLFYLGGMGHLNHVTFLGQTISSGTIVTFYMYISKFFTPIQNLAEQFNWLQSALASSEKVFSIMDIQPQMVDAPDAVELDEVKGDIEFRDVWFSYIPGEWVLQGVSFHVEPRQTVAFVGSTGSGKSTILSLICRNYEFQKGEILIDGIDIRKIKISSLRRHFGQMLQDVFLFSGTIRSNIVLREENIPDEEIMKVCRYVNADHFINKLEHGLDEEVRERGNNFSAGQRQLLSFARTILHKPSVMILDEATANIDTETELLIQDSLEKMRSVGTMLIVAHRLSTIQHADNIIVLSRGRILEQGTHQQLLAAHGRYYQLYTLQYHKEQMDKQ